MRDNVYHYPRPELVEGDSGKAREHIAVGKGPSNKSCGSQKQP